MTHASSVLGNTLFSTESEPNATGVGLTGPSKDISRGVGETTVHAPMVRDYGTDAWPEYGNGETLARCIAHFPFYFPRPSSYQRHIILANGSISLVSRASGIDGYLPTGAALPACPPCRFFSSSAVASLLLWRRSLTSWKAAVMAWRRLNTTRQSSEQGHLQAWQLTCL